MVETLEIAVRLLTSLLVGVGIGSLYSLHKQASETRKVIGSIKKHESGRTT